MERWHGKVAVITGASAGIGASLAEKLVEEGLQVVGFARRKSKIDELAEKLSDKNGKLFGVKVDMTKEDEIIEGFNWTIKNVGPISILVNNAGVSKLNTLIAGNTDMWREVLDTNVLGLTIATREAIKSMQANSIDGHIVNINSICGHQVTHLPYQNMYTASKYAVTALTETFRKDLLAISSKIKMSSVSPGYVETEFCKAANFTDNEQLWKLIENAAALQSEDVANAVVYVLGTPPHVQISELTIKPVGEIV